MKPDAPFKGAEGQRPRRCPACGTPYPSHEHDAGCPVCLLRRAMQPESTAVDDVTEAFFDHYELARRDDDAFDELGRGAMGVTYKAFDTVLGHAVALKVLDARVAARPDARERFLREARAAARLRHPNVASVFYYGVRKSDGQCFYTMELVEGETLEARLRREGPLPASLALEVVTQMARAMAATESQGLVHRDLKPSNLMLVNGPELTVKVIDFGLAKAAAVGAGETDLTQGGFVGTPMFASPEQCAGSGVDARSDLYSLGIMLWVMLTGQAPFRGGLNEVMHQHVNVPLPLEKLTHVPHPVVSLIKSLLERDPAKRPQGPSELHTLLHELKAALRSKAQVQAVLPEAVEPKQAGVLHHDLERMRAVMQAAVHGEPRDRRWPPFVDPWDFTPFLLTKFKAFTGRQWLFQEIEEWRAHGPQPALLVVGEPGIGKSSIVAAMVHENRDGQVLAYHCCRADTPATLEPAGFVRNLVAMLATHLDGYAAMLAGRSIVNALRLAETDPVSAFERVILGPVHQLRPVEQGRRYLLIDALDEALMRTRRPTIVDVLSTRLNLLPPWLRIVATTRSEPGVLRQLGGLRAHTLNAQDPRNQDDVHRFIEHRLAESALRVKARASAKGPTELAATLLKSSAGNFLYVTTALDAIESGQLSFDQIEQLPPGLSCLYELFFNRLFRDVGVDFGLSRQVLETVAAAAEPLMREQIAAATGLDAFEELPPILARLASFVPAGEGRYAFFHRSLFDWLTGWDPLQDQPLAEPYHVSLKNGRKRLADWCWTAYQRSPSQLPRYVLRHLPGHLYQVSRTHEARSVLLDFDFLRAKLEATDANALIHDFEYFSKEPDLWLVQSAFRLSAHVLARDPRELAGQLTGRLLGNTLPSIQALLNRIAERNAGVWLRPLTPSLTQPGGPLIRTLEDHTGWVTAVAVTPDGQRAVSASHDRTLRVWDLQNGHRLRKLEGHAGWVHAVAVTPDGRRAISASGDHTLRVWNLETGQSLRTLEGHTDWVSAVAITPDGRCAISGSGDRTVRVWDLASGQTLRTLEGHVDTIAAIAITPNGSHAVSASSDRTLRVWDLASGQTLRTLEGHGNTVNAVAITPNGSHAVSASSDRTVRVWDLGSGQTLRTLEGHGNTVTGAVAITPDGRRGVSASANYTVSVWNLESGQTLRTLEGHTDWITAVAVTPDGRSAVSASADQTLRLWDLESSQALHPPEGCADGITAVVLSPDGRRTSLTSDYDMLRVRDLDSGQVLGMLQGHTDWVTAVAVAPDGRRAVSGSGDHTVRVWDLENGESLRILQGHTDSISAVAITPDGRRTISGSGDHTVRVWDLESGQSVCALESQTDLISALAITPDARHAIWGSATGALRVWGSETGQALRTLEGHTGWVTAVAVTPDGRLAVSASADQTLRVWDLESGQSVRTLEGHLDRVTTVAVTPNGRRAISASVDHTLRVWDVESGEYVAGFSVEGPLLRFAVAPDGRTIVAREKSGRGHVLRVEGLDREV